MSELENLRRLVADYERRWKSFLHAEPDPDDVAGSLYRENILLKERVAQLASDNEVLEATVSELGAECSRLKAYVAQLEPRS